MRSPTSEPLPPYFVQVRFGPTGAPFWEVFWRHRSSDGKTRATKRRIGAAWVEADGEEWRKRSGRCPPTHLDERTARATAAEIVRDVTGDLLADEAARRRRDDVPVTFRVIAAEYLRWLEEIKGAKPSTLRDHGFMLSEPGVAHRRGPRVTTGRIMAALGDRPAAAVTTREVNALLSEIAASGVSPRTVNKHRNLVAAIFTYACDESTFGLAANPASRAERRREPEPGVLDYYSPEEIEALARMLSAGGHRDPSAPAVTEDEAFWRRHEDDQDAQAVRLAAYTGLRRGELVALRWRDVDYAKRKLFVRTAVSGDVLATSTKSGKHREVPLSDQAIAALGRLQQRGDFTSPADFVLVNRAGGRIEGSALRRRVGRAMTRAGLRPLRFHDLRHTFGSLLIAAGVDIVTVQAAMGHSRITTTQRYLHARPAHEVADRFTAAFDSTRDLGATTAASPQPSGAARRTRTSA